MQINIPELNEDLLLLIHGLDLLLEKCKLQKSCIEFEKYKSAHDPDLKEAYDRYQYRIALLKHQLTEKLKNQL